jgi:FkbM family methyltransferase
VGVRLTEETKLEQGCLRRLLTRQRLGLYYLSLRSGLLDAFGIPRSLGLDELDVRVAKYFDYSRGGFFIESGANDGISQSNSLYFERYLGWTGLLIEPIPGLVEACRRNRPKAIVEHAALVPFDHPDTIEMRFCGLMSVVRNGMRSRAEEDEHIRVGSEIQNIAPYDVTVPAKPLQSILDAHDIKECDLLMLDVEGYEAQVLSGIDFDRFSPRAMLIEARYRDAVEKVLAGRYRIVEQFSGKDYLFQPTPFSGVSWSGRTADRGATTV